MSERVSEYVYVVFPRPEAFADAFDHRLMTLIAYDPDVEPEWEKLVENAIAAGGSCRRVRRADWQRWSVAARTVDELRDAVYRAPKVDVTWAPKLVVRS